ncbi:putative riboflavin kinase isoform X1 [Drosophila albomicans]|uniref:Riboflavin kinase n=2 Tax=Drosophila albomicans TaxID=7291 RepID=A0A6P8XH91_DROAB|nr:putative riboflavin kinase isoform X1 [Drosophila albomicans]
MIVNGFSRKLSSNLIKAIPQSFISCNHRNPLNRKANVKFYSNSNNNGEYLKNISKMQKQLPIYACGEIVRGFGRGSKELGIPTANMSLEAVKALPDSLQTGVYYGWAKVNDSDVHKMVLSIGWNPFYNNKEKSVETHILHEFKCDLYGRTLKICIVGYLRPEQNFDSLEALIETINSDIDQAKTLLDSVDSKQFKENSFFKETIEKS